MSIAVGAAANVGLPVMGAAFKLFYNVAGELNNFVDNHIEELKGKENIALSRTGRILEGVKSGFGIGYLSPVIVISAGQILLGNVLSAVGTVATAATLTNPIAMTCGAVGAVYFGWQALSKDEREAIIEKLSKGFEVGLELIKAIIRFAIDSAKEIFSAENLEEVKKFIAESAKAFGKTLGDVTRKLSDIASDALHDLKIKAGEVVDKTVDMTQQACEAVKTKAEKTTSDIIYTVDKMKNKSKCDDSQSEDKQDKS